MKKWISFIMILFLAFIFVGCGDDPKPDEGDGKGETVKPTEIVVTGIEEGQELEANQSITLQVKVLPDDATNKKYRVVSSNPAVLKVQDDTITALSAGEVVLTITAVGDTSVKKAFNLKVKGEEAAPVEPTKITITATKNEVEEERVITLTVTAEPENATKTVKWSSSDESIAKVNANGMVTGVKQGEATITATSTLNDKVYGEFKVKVIEPKEIIIDKVDPESIEITLSDEEVIPGYSVTARATVYPNGADQNVVWSLKESSKEFASIDENGKITGIKKGTIYVIATSKSKPSVSTQIKMKVLAEPAPIIPDDLKGYTITIMNADSDLVSYNPFLDGYKSADKMYRQQAWKEIESDYNCKIDVIAYPDEAPWGATRYQWINSQAEVGASQSDFAILSSSWISNVASVGSLHNAKSYYQKYGKNQMTLSMKQAATFKGGLYGLSTGANETRHYVDLGLYYNLAWIEKLKVESPAKLFNEGKWTYSTFIDWANQVQALLGEGEYALAGSLYYYWIGMTSITGIIVANPTTAEVTLSDARQIAAADVLQRLVASGALTTTSSWMETSGEFMDGTAVMTSGHWSFMKSSSRWKSDMWGEDTRFGFVPFPYPDDMSKDQIRVAEYGTTVIAFLNGRDSAHPAGVTYEMIYKAMTDYYIRGYEYYAKDASYDPDTIKRNNIENKVDDPESVEAALFFDSSKVFYDAVHDFFESISGSQLAGSGKAIDKIVKGADYQQTMDELQDTYVKTFLQIFA